MVKRHPSLTGHRVTQTTPAISPNPTEKKRSRGENPNDIAQETMEIEDSGDPKQDLTGRFEALATASAEDTDPTANMVAGLQLYP